MKVSKLIEYLNALPQESEVYLDPLFANSEMEDPFKKITSVKLGNAKITKSVQVGNGEYESTYERAVLLGTYLEV